MSDLTHDGRYLVSFLTTLASLTAPSAVAVAAGIPLDQAMTPSGLTRPWTSDSIDNSRINSLFTTSATGRRSVALSITLIRDTVDVLGFEAALAFQAFGFLVIRDTLLSSVAWASTQKAEVYPVQVKAPAKSDPAPNSLQTITYGFDMPQSPVLNAVLAA